MEIDEERSGETIIAEPRGQLDSASAPLFADRVGALIAGGGVRLLVDLAGVSYIASAGLSVLLALRHRVGATRGGMALCCATRPVREVLEISGVASVIACHATRAEGVAALAARAAEGRPARRAKRRATPRPRRAST